MEHYLVLAVGLSTLVRAFVMGLEQLLPNMPAGVLKVLHAVDAVAQVLSVSKPVNKSGAPQ